MSCSVISCKNAKHKNEPGITFHRFPNQSDRRHAWLAAIGRRHWNPRKTSSVCSKHFKESDFHVNSSFRRTFLKLDAVPSVDIPEQLGKRKMEPEKSLFLKSIQVQNAPLINEKVIGKLGLILVRDNQGRNVLVVPSEPDVKDVTENVSQNIKPLQAVSSIPLNIKTTQGSSDSSQGSSASASQNNQSGVNSIKKTSDAIKTINTLLETINVQIYKGPGTTSAVSHHPGNPPGNAFSDLNTTPKLSNAAHNSVTTDKTSKFNKFIKLAKKKPISLSNFHPVKTGNLKTVPNPAKKCRRHLNTMKDLPNVAQYSIATDKVYKTRQSARKAGESSESLSDFYANQTEVPNQVEIQGRRIVDIDYVFKILKIANQHSTSGCNLNDIIITAERNFGLSSSFSLKCTMCDYRFALCSENPNKSMTVNSGAVAGMFDINCSLKDMNKLLFNMELPKISQSVYVTERDKRKRVLLKRNFPVVPSKLSKKTSQHTPLDTAFQFSAFSGRTYLKPAKETDKNITQNPKPVTDSISDSAALNKNFVQSHLNEVLVEDQFEIKVERIDTEYENPSEKVSPQHVALNDKTLLSNQEHLPLNITQIKQEVIWDEYEEGSVLPETREVEMVDKGGVWYHDNSKISLSHQNHVRTFDNKIAVDKYQMKYDKNLVKQEIQDDNSLT